MSIKTPGMNGTAAQPIAIIGMACRFPGEATSLESFWKIFEDGIDAIGDVPPDRYDIDYYYEPSGRPGKIITPYGGFLPDVDKFDPSFFGITPREAMYIDPQHRMLLEVAWEAIENGGQRMDRMVGSQTGVFIGIWTNNYNDRYLSASEDVHFHILLGGPRYPAAGRISYAFDFRGPSFVIDTACSSSLVAVHLACQSIWSGESEMALAGGVNIILDPMSTVGGSQSDILSPDGRCQFGDANANGYVRSEGVGMVLVKPLAQALADNDPIYAVIRGSAVNNDGRSGGRLSAPGLQAQIDVLREAYGMAGVCPAEVAYMEAHGTGTAVGDPIEIEALATVLGENRPPTRPFILGSGKTNIGHTEAAAGIAGLIKAVLCLNHRAAPGNIHFKNPNPTIPWSELPFVMPTTLQPWPESDGPAYAGVNSFGITGTNAHIVLQEPPVTNMANGHPTPAATTRPYLIPLSAHTPEALTALAQRYHDFVSRQAVDTFSLADFAYTLARRRTHHAQRLTLVVRDREELLIQLQAYVDGEMRPGMAAGSDTGQEQPIAFVCSGMGPQWWAMGRELLETEQLFREAVEACDAHFKPLAGWSLLDELAASEETSRMDRVDVSQPANFALQVGLAALWQSWGVGPDAIVGHSTGEVATAYLAGILTLADAVTVTYHRSRLQQLAVGEGEMAAVGLSLSDVQEYLARAKEPVSVAAVNSPSSVTLAGDRQAVNVIADWLAADDVFVRLLETNVAYHSPHMDKLREELLASLENIKSRPAAVTAYSTVSGKRAESNSFDGGYWWDNVREPVFFAQAIEQMIGDGYRTFVELSPHPVLARSLRESLEAAEQEGTIVASLHRRQPQQQQMLEALGALHAAGHTIDWAALYPQGKFMPLPTYPWRWESLWFEEERVRKGPARVGRGSRSHYAHPFLEQHIQSAARPDTHLWQMKLDAEQFEYLMDHRIGELAVVPGATWLEMMIAAANETFGEGVCILEDVHFEEGYILSEESVRLVQMVLTAPQAGRAVFRLLSRQEDESGQADEWSLHATGRIRIETAGEAPAPHSPPTEIQAESAVEMAGDALYRALEHLVLSYGPAFRGIERIWHNEMGTLGRLALSETMQREANDYHVHPALLDSAFQVLHGPVANLSQHEIAAAPKDAYIPVGVDSLHFYRRPPAQETWCYTRLQPVEGDNTDRLKGDIILFDENGEIYLELSGLRLQKLERNPAEQINDWLYKIEWQPKALAAEQSAAPESTGVWLILADGQGVADYLHSVLVASGERCVVVPAGEASGEKDVAYWQDLLDETTKNDLDGIRAIIHLWSLESEADAPSLSSLATAQEQSCISLLHLVQALSQMTADSGEPPALWVLTRSAQPVGLNGSGPAIAQSSVWGLARVIMQEHPELACRLIDLGPATTAAEFEALFQELYANDGEDQIALRPDGRYVARLSRTVVETPSEKQSEPPQLAPAGDRAYRLEGTPGVLDSLVLRESEPPQLEPDDVCIEVRAAGLNFMDVLSALGALPSHPNGIGPLGTECAGVVVAVGEEVTDIAVGDEVLALVYGSFVRYVCTDARHAVRIPAGMSFAEAATIPLAFLTAHYSLRHMGRLRAGERILIHTASGGVGLAAVQIAQSLGAEIFATAGNPEKRQFLRDLGIEHVMDSRTLDFAGEIMEITDGAGVDVVLNTLAGEFLLKSIEVLGKHGRFVEIGKRDIYQNSQIGLYPFRRNLAFHAVDMDPIFLEQDDFTQELLHEVMAYVNSDAYKPLPRRVFSPSQIAEAYQFMARAKHIGKIVATFDDPQEAPIAPPHPGPIKVQSNASYLITGGLGGLGLQVAQWLVEQGARQLVLVSRSGASEQSRPALQALEAAGAQVTVMRADVSSEEDVQRLLQNVGETLPPLRGVIHAAGVLADATIANLTREQYQTVIAPKIQGAWNLHQHSLQTPLDFFILFSSVATLVGTPGQGNYVAANTFLDALAHYRRSQGLPALSLNWGAWSEVGMAAAQSNRGERMEVQGIGSLSPEEGIMALAHVFNHQKPQIGIMEFNLAQWAQAFPRALDRPILAQLAAELSAVNENGDGPQEARTVREELLAARPRERQDMLLDHVREQVVHVLRVAPARIEPNTTMQSLGVDSLMALEIRGRLEATFGVTLSGTVIWNYPTPSALATHIAGKMGISLKNGQQPTAEMTAAATESDVTPDIEAELSQVLEAAIAADD